MASKIWDNSGSFGSQSLSVAQATSTDHRIPLATEADNFFITPNILLSGVSASIASTNQTASIVSASFSSRIVALSSSLLTTSQSITDTINQVSSSLNQSIAAIEVPIGSIVMYGGDSAAPSRYFFCDGTPLFRVDYPALFSVIGTLWGAPDDSRFNVPNLNGRVPVGKGQMSATSRSWTVGDKFGEDDHILTSQEMPGHNHVMTHGRAQADGNVPNPAGGLWIDGTDGSQATTTSTGGNLAHNNIQPSLGINFIIRAL